MPASRSIRPLRWRAQLLAAVLTLACQEDPLPSPANQVCEVTQSTNACFRCQAQRCGAGLDRCYGTGFHQGRAVPAPAGCRYDSDLNQFTGQCDRGGRALDPAPPCAPMATCLQACGCGLDCARACQAPPPDGGAPVTTYYSNDPRLTVCSDCVKEALESCTKQNCAVVCPPPT
jgi:hypothetical protein